MYMTALCAVFAVGCGATSDSEPTVSGNGDDNGAVRQRDMMGLAASVRFDDDEQASSLLDASNEMMSRDAGVQVMNNQTGETSDESDAGAPPIRVDMAVPMQPELCLELPEPPEAPVLQSTIDCRNENRAPRIQDVQAPNCGNRFDEGDMIELADAVVTAIFPPKPGRDTQWDFVIQDPAGGSYSGIWIYVNVAPLTASWLRVMLFGSKAV